ncbi:MAG TPA: hypothetical protein VF789_05065 [Thermoanaerobaculia bacterium]
MNDQPTPFDSDDVELTALFRRSREEEVWTEPANAASMIWWRAQAADLVAGEIRRKEGLIRPLTAARDVAAVAALAAVELAIFQGGAVLLDSFPDFGKALASAGLTPLTAAILALAIPPTLALLHHFRRVADDF